ASQGEVIILGRGAQIVLRDVRQVYRIRVVAPTHLRVLHMRQVHGMSTDEAVEFVRVHDQRRRSLIRQVFDHDLKDWGLYDMVLNTAHLDVQAGVEIIKTAIRENKRLQPTKEASQVLLDLALGKRVEAKIRHEVLPTQEVEVLGESGGKVILTGSLAAKEDRQLAEKVAQNYPGVTSVVNNIKASILTFGY
ncbi:MAG: cytidylate kinase family protein, partial [Deltaproteobacteria bacterium]|nr:cytidylate kinase family protein [Deltaproteobacteria bacterium]